MDDSTSMRVGGGHSNFEILKSIGYGSEISSSITNLDDSLTLQFTVIWVDASTPAMDQGVIDWDEIKNIQSENNATIYSLEPGEERTISITEEKKWHLIIFHNEAEDVDDVIPIRIINDYGNEEETMYKSLALSLPSLWMTGFVVYRVVRLKKANRSLIDSTPSHLWEEE